MTINWEALAKQVGDIGDQEGSSTLSGRRALEILLGEEQIRGAVDYWISQKPGCFTAEMVLSILRSRIAMERCYEIYKAERGTENAIRAVFLLAVIAESMALPWVSEFLSNESLGIRWNGLIVISTVLRGPLNDEGIELARQLLRKAESDSDSRLSQRAREIELEFSSTLATSPE